MMSLRCTISINVSANSWAVNIFFMIMLSNFFKIKFCKRRKFKHKENGFCSFDARESLMGYSLKCNFRWVTWDAGKIASSCLLLCNSKSARRFYFSYSPLISLNLKRSFYEIFLRSIFFLIINLIWIIFAHSLTLYFLRCYGLPICSHPM